MLGRGFEELGEFKVIGFFCICNASLSDRQTSRNACIYCRMSELAPNFAILG